MKNRYITDNLKEDVYIYEFPKLTKEDICWLEKHTNLFIIPGFEDDNDVYVKGTLKDIKHFANDYLGYEFVDEYLTKDDIEDTTHKDAVNIVPGMWLTLKDKSNAWTTYRVQSVEHKGTHSTVKLAAYSFNGYEELYREDLNDQRISISDLQNEIDQVFTSYNEVKKYFTRKLQIILSKNE